MATTFQGGPGKVPARAGLAVARQARGSPAMLQVMQRSAGNAAVASYVQRLAESPGPAGPTGLAPSSDPRFLAVATKVASQGKALRGHPSPRAEVEKVKDAAVPPAGDKEAQAKEAQAATMAGAKPAGFDKAGFIAAVKAAIAAQAPKTLEEAEEFGKSGKAEAVKNQVAGKVADGKAASAKDIADKTAAAPDQSKAVDKPVTPLAPEPQPASARVDAAAGMPAPAPPARTDLSGGKRDTDAAMAGADVSEQQLANSNEPAFVGALAAKKQGEEHSAAAPAAFREKEGAQLGSAKQAAQGAGASGLAGMLSAKKGALGKAAAGKGAAKSKDEAERAKVAGEVKAIFDATKNDVAAILGSLDGAVSTQFSAGEKGVRDAFTADLNGRMQRYKDERYAGLEGKARWLSDKLGSLPPEANKIYEAARSGYEGGMGKLIGEVADTIGGKLSEAKDRIARGRAEIKAYVDSKPKNLQKVAQAAAGQFAEQFDQLENDVDSKKDALVEDLAAKYVESKAAVDAEVTAMQDENKGWWDKAKDAVGGAIKTIMQLKDMLLTVLARAANAVGDIIKNPIGFLGNLIEGVKGGILKFKDNILGHLKKGLMGWLFGALAEGGVELPDTFDIKGIIKLLASIFGLTWANIRNRLVLQIGEKAMAAVEKGVEIFQVIASQGLAGLWQMLLEKLGNIKDMILEQVKDFVITKIITAGITWLIGLLNPAAAFIKACKLIYDVVMFFVNNAERIMKFVNTIIDSVVDIVRGNVSSVVNKIEDVLGQMVPILIGFLASAIGLGGIGQKIREIIEKLQKPVNKALDFVIKTGLKLAGPIIRGLKSFGGKVKGKIAAGKAWVKGKAEAGKKWVKGKVSEGKAWAKNKAAGVTEFFSLRQRFDVDGEKHSLFTTGQSGHLTVASTPTSLDKHPDPAVRAAYGTYLTAVDAAKTPAAKKTASAKPLGVVILALKAWLKRGKKKDPQASAPGIGNIAAYRHQPSSLRADFVVWALEAEHVVPRGFSNAIFKALKVEGIPAGGTDYRGQTTIMIYKGAANQKTHGGDADNAMTREIKTNLADIIAEYHKAKPSAKKALAEVVFNSLFNLLAGYADDAAKRTSIAVDHENRRNSARRGPPGTPEAVTPAPGKVRQAAGLQIQDIVRQLRARL